MVNAFDFILNGRSVHVTDFSPNTTLLEYLRAYGLTGSKEGGAEGDCGARSVAMIARDAGSKPTWRAVDSCLMPICLVVGRELVSVEGVCNSARPTPHFRACPRPAEDGRALRFTMWLSPATCEAI